MLFRSVIMAFYGERILPVDLSGINIISVIIFVVGFLGLRKWKVNPIYVMLGAGAAGVLLYSAKQLFKFSTGD